MNNQHDWHGASPRLPSALRSRLDTILPVARRTEGRTAVSAVITIFAVFVSLAVSAGAGTAKSKPVGEYTLKNAKAPCRAGYSKKTKWLKRPNKHHKLVRVKKTVCVQAPIKEYTLKSAKARCRAGYVKKTKWVKRRNRHHKLVRVKKTVCVYREPKVGPPNQAPPNQAAPSAVGWGYNGRGELGPGYRSNISTTAAPVIGVAPIKEIAAAGEWGAALLTDGTVKAWGGNVAGQLGDGTTEAKSTPVAVKGLAGPVTQLAAASEHVISVARQRQRSRRGATTSLGSSATARTAAAKKTAQSYVAR